MARKKNKNNKLKVKIKRAVKDDNRLTRGEIKKISKKTGAGRKKVQKRAEKLSRNFASWDPKKEFKVSDVKPKGAGSANLNMMDAIAAASKDNELSRKDLKGLQSQFAGKSAKRLSKLITRYGKRNEDLTIFKGDDLQGYLRKLRRKDNNQMNRQIPDRIPGAKEPKPPGMNTDPKDPKTPKVPGMQDLFDPDLIGKINDFLTEDNKFLMNDSMFIGGRNAGGVRFRKSKNKNRAKGTGQLKRSVRNQGLTMNPVNV